MLFELAIDFVEPEDEQVQTVIDEIFSYIKNNMSKIALWILPYFKELTTMIPLKNESEKQLLDSSFALVAEWTLWNKKSSSDDVLDLDKFENFCANQPEGTYSSDIIENAGSMLESFFTEEYIFIYARSVAEEWKVHCPIDHICVKIDAGENLSRDEFGNYIRFYFGNAIEYYWDQHCPDTE